SSRGATDKIRVHHQSESGEADRPDDPSQRAGESGQSHQVRADGDREKAMKQKITVLTLSALLFALCHPAEAQQTLKMFRVGILGIESKERKERIAQYLRELGYIEGKNVVYEIRAIGSAPEPYADFAAELVQLKVDVIVAGGAGAVRAAKNAS